MFALTSARDLSWENYGGDGAELITAAATLGVPHPPGYPSYVILGKLVSEIPFGAVALRFNLFSAAAMALAAGFVTDICRRRLEEIAGTLRTNSILPAMSAGLAFAFAPLAWGQATVAEVYALNLAIVGAFLWALSSSRPPILVGTLLGLSVTTHLSSLLLLPAGLALTPTKDWRPFGLGLLLGLAPYTAVPLWAGSGSPVVWGEPGTLHGWWALVSGQLYRSNVLSLQGTALAERLGEWAPLLATQFTAAGLPLFVVGAYRYRKRWRINDTVILLSAALFLGYAIGYSSSDAIVFTLPGLMLVAIALAPGISLLGRWSPLLPLISVLLNFGSHDLSQHAGVRAPAEALLAEAPDGALLLTPGDATLFTLMYFHTVEGIRPDLKLADSNLFAFDWYRKRLGDRYPDLGALELDDIGRFVADNRAVMPLCLVQLDGAPATGAYGIDCAGGLP
jgi:hypothetical protein